MTDCEHCTCVGHSVTICCYCGGDRRDGRVNLYEREGGPSQWVAGSRERLGEAYFVSPITGKDRWMLWQNRRPYAANEPVGPVPYPPTWRDIDAAIQNAVSGKPDTYVQRTYEGVTLFDETGERIRLREDDAAVFFWEMRGRLIDSCSGEGDCEFIICSRVDEHDHNVAEASYSDFGTAMTALFAARPGHYMVAVRP